MCPDLCVLPVTCWVRSKESSRYINFDAKGLLMSSTWKLKSPTIRRVPGDIVVSSKKVANSLKNISGDSPFFYDGGGLYMAIRWILMLLNVMTIFIYSKELKVDVG